MSKKYKYISTSGHLVENSYNNPDTWRITKTGEPFRVLTVTRLQIKKTYKPAKVLKD
jgi:hypothetical protein